MPESNRPLAPRGGRSSLAAAVLAAALACSSAGPSGSPPGTVATPTFSPPGGNYPAAQSVALSCTTAGSAIHYTTDGTQPTASSPTYSSAIAVSATTTVRAMAVHGGYADSAIAQAVYTIGSSASMEVIYDDAPAPLWQTIWGWGSMAYTQQTATKHAGTTALHVTAGADYAGFGIVRIDGPDWAGTWHPVPVLDYRNLRAWISFAQTAAIPGIDVYLTDGNDTVGSTVALASYLPASPAAGTWYELVVPVADFAAPSGAAFLGFAMSLGASGTVSLFLDDIRLEGGVDPDDHTPPVVSNVHATTGSTSASVCWSANEITTALVQYGVGSTAEHQASLTQPSSSYNQCLKLTGLTPVTTYEYTVTATDLAGNAAAATAVATFTTQPAPPASTQWLFTKAGSNRIYYLNGAAEVEWIGRGVNVADLFLCGYNATVGGGAWMASADAEAELGRTIAAAVTDWKANFLRLSLSMDSTGQIAHWSDSDPYAYKAAMTRVIDAIGEYPNVYVLVTVRSDTTMVEGDAGNEASYYPTASTYTQVYRELVKSFRDSPQVMIGLTNEGGGNGFNGNPAGQRTLWTDAVAAIRAEEGTGSHHLVAVQGTGYASDLAYLGLHPLEADGVIYEYHSYPPTAAGYTFLNIPVFVGEYGSIDAGSAATLFSDWEDKRISSAAWIFDPHAGCAPDLLQVTHDGTKIDPTTYGSLVMQYLQAHPQ